MINSILDISISDWLLTILSILLSFTIPYFIIGVYNYISKIAPSLKIWGLKNVDTIYIAIGQIESSEKLNGNGSFILGKSDLKALLEITSILKSIYKKINIKPCFSKQLTVRQMVNENIILIGSPKWNDKTLKILNRGDSPFGFDRNDWHVIDKIEDKHYNIKDPDTQDIGIVIKRRNPYNPDKSMFIFAGIHSSGVYAATRCLSPYNTIGSRRIKDISKRIGKNQYFSFAVNTEIIRDTMGEEEAHPKGIIRHTFQVEN
jgi:hypothetical protein